ncbi:hypothetical protein AGMMS49942_11970 [Spirochaetia bacterium]|nr:hypothetical protein AGMMS49942_11970 [Spirochaetia bacterium]
MRSVNRYLSMAILLFVVLLSGCDIFNEPIEPFVQGQTGLIRMAGGIDGDTVFPVVESTLMVPLVNGTASPLRVLVLSNGAPVDPARIWADDPVVEDRVVLHIRGAVVGEVFNLTLRLWAEGSNRVFDDLVVPPIRCIPNPLITSFGITSPVTASGTVTGAGYTVNVPYGTALSAMTAVVTYTGTSITGGGTTLTTSPATFTGVNFTAPVPFTVTAEDGSLETYAVTVTPGALTAAIGGTPRVGQTLTAIPAPIGPGVTLSYQWERSNGSGFAPIPGATGLTYVLKGDDLDNYLRVAISHAGNSITSAVTGQVTYGIVVPASPDLTIKFGIRGSAGVPLTKPMVENTFTSLHQLISTPAPGESVTSKIALGNYIDLPSLTITGSGTILDQDIGSPGPSYRDRLLRLIVVGINSYKTGGAAANNIGAPDHVVFQFRNGPVLRRMNSSATNVGGYAGSEMQSYLTTYFLPGLIDAGVPENVLWAPKRRVWNGFFSGEGGSGSSNDLVDTIEKKLWLPTVAEMSGGSASSLANYEATGQAALGYYTDPISRKKGTIGGITEGIYWLASPYKTSCELFCYVTANGVFTGAGANQSLGVAPAFCVK